MVKKISKYLNRYGAKITILTVFLTALYTLFEHFNYNYLLISLIAGWIMYGLSMIVNHRYMSHSVFEAKNKFVLYLMYSWVVLFGSGSPLSWAYSHRLHHIYTDVPPDPQSPKTVGYIKTFFAWPSNSTKFKSKFVRDLIQNKEVMFVHTYYYTFFFSYLILLMIFSPILFGYVCLSISFSYSLLGILNTWAHSGNSIKSIPLPILLFGEENHAYHHTSVAASRVVNTSQWDLQGVIIKNFLAKSDSLSYRKAKLK